MSAWDAKGKVAVVTGAGSGLGHAIAQRLLREGCSVVMADLRLRPEAEETRQKYAIQSEEKEDGKEGENKESASAVFVETDLANWSQINRLWKTALDVFGHVDLLVNGAGLYEPPSSDFWNPPGLSPLSEDPVDAEIGIYKTYAVNTIAPIRLAQIAVEYWLRPENRHIEGNILWLASMAGYIHGLLTPFYFSSKAAVVSMVKSLGGLHDLVGIRNAAICPGVVDTPIFHPQYSRERVHTDDLMLTIDELVDVAWGGITSPKFGNGNIIEVFCGGTHDKHEVCTRDVPLDAVYNIEGLAGLAQGTHLIAKQEEFLNKIKTEGMGFN